jgi:hypothetical protein
MTIADAFGALAANISTAIGGPYFDALIHHKGVATYDSGGSIVTPGTPTSNACLAQVDAMTEAMRAQDGFVEGDARILVLAHGLTGTIDTDNSIQITAGPHVGRWLIQSRAFDPMGVYYELRGRGT